MKGENDEGVLMGIKVLNAAVMGREESVGEARI